MHWSYVFLALTHRYGPFKFNMSHVVYPLYFCQNISCALCITSWMALSILVTIPWVIAVFCRIHHRFCYSESIFSSSSHALCLIHHGNTTFKWLFCFSLHHFCIIKSPQSGVILCFQFVSAASAASASAATKTFPSHIKTVWSKPLIFGAKNIWFWGNVLDDLSMTLTQGHGCGVV